MTRGCRIRIDLIAAALATAGRGSDNRGLAGDRGDDGYMPNPAAAKIVTAVPNGPARTGVVILTISSRPMSPTPGR